MPITDLSIETILQIDATLITGILILLTIGNLKNPSGTSFQTSKAGCYCSDSFCNICNSRII